MFNEGDLRLIAPSHEARLAFEIKDGKATDKLSSVNSHVAELKCRGNWFNVFYFILVNTCELSSLIIS